MQAEELSNDIKEEDSQEEFSSNDIDKSVNEESEKATVDKSGETKENVEKEESIETIEESLEETTIKEKEFFESEIATDKEKKSNVVDSSIDESENYTESVVYFSDTSVMDYSELYQDLLAEQQVTNELLYRVNEQNDFMIGVGVTLIICCIAYSILEKFCRF